jgi:lipopolysaccharide transport system permease protein
VNILHDKMTEQHDYVVDASQQKLFDFREIWSFRELFFFFTWRDIKIKYKQTTLGFLWAILQPLLMMVIFTFFFGKVLNVPSQNLPYPIFVFSGLLLWNTFSGGLTNAANSMVNNAAIIKKIYFPRLVIPVSSILVAIFDFFMAFILFIPLLIYYKQRVSLDALWLWPLSILVSLIAILGLGSWLSALNVKYRDVRYVIPFLIQVLFFLTPVIYPVSMLTHPLLKYITVLSPMYAAIELFRTPLTQVYPDFQLLLISILSGIFLLVTGLLYFKRTEVFFADLA